ncbi:MAG: FtsW/RodA/SpoVE family cell cycle protein [Erysipelotrichaceae bacterium]|nr:FtsW/RodA/SpoVE family cell cycle protein [Erysipelotrichaceae bacterium]
MKKIRHIIDLIRKIFKSRGVDRAIYFCVIILAIYGIIMIGSASVGSTAKYGANYAIMNMVKQAIFVVIGLGIMIFFTRCFKKSWINEYTTWILYFIGFVMLLACLFFEDVNGSKAWIHVGSLFTIQSSEFMKIILILFLSYHFGEIEEYCVIPRNISVEKRHSLYLRKIWYCIIRPVIASLAVFAVVALLQSDLGSALIIAFICLGLFYVTPRPFYRKFKKIVSVLLVGCIAVFAFLAGFVLKSHQLARFTSWLNPLGDALGDSYQLVNSMIAFSNGGLFGLGFGSSKQKYGFIPESHNDFIAAIIYEELGLVGFLLFLIPYCIIIYRLFQYGLKMKDTKSKLILYGVGLYFFAHLIVNVGGVSGLIPMTGVPLLLISYGGSSLWASMIGLGICQSIIAKYNRDLLKAQIE